MKNVLFVCAVLVMCVGCASMPVIGPFSYLASSSESARNTRGPSPSGTDITVAGLQGVFGYAADMTMYLTAIKLADDELNKDSRSSQDRGQTLPPVGNGNVILMNNGSGSISYSTMEGL